MRNYYWKMKELEELEKKYAELGREIEALKTKYPIYSLSQYSGRIIKFTDLEVGVVVKQSNAYNVGYTSYHWPKHTDTENWQQLDVCPETGFYDGQLVWAWNEEDTHTRELRFYDTKNTCNYFFNGNRDGYVYDNYEPYEGNWPTWALEAFKTLEK